MIPSSHDWAVLPRDYLSWTRSLDIDDVTIAGLQIRVEAHNDHPDEFVRAQLEYQPPNGKREPLVRVEWRPLTQHNNKGKGPAEWRFKPFRSTHVHRFEMNWNEARGRMLSGNLPVAVPLQDIDSYDKFLDVCATELNIGNMSIIPVPPWNPRMI